MSNIIIVDFRDSEDFENHPYISYLKETLNMISYLEQVPELWKLNDFFIECVSDYLEIKRERVLLIGYIRGMKDILKKKLMRKLPV